MSNSWFLAVRLLLWRQDDRRVNWATLLAITGVMVGCLILVLSLSILNGFESRVHGNLERFYGGPVLIPTAGAHDGAMLRSRLDGLGLVYEPYAERKVILHSSEGYRLVTARIVPDIDAYLDEYSNAVEQRLPYQPLERPVAIGSLTAANLTLLPGDEVRIISPLDISLGDPNPPQIVGAVYAIWEFGLLNFDDEFILLNFETAALLISGVDELAGIKLIGADEGLISAAQAVALDTGWQVRTWQKEHADLITAMQLEKLGSAIVLFLIIIVACFNATSTMVMMVMEKQRQIGILRSMGAARRLIRRIFLQQGAIIGFAGTFSGVGLGSILAWLQIHYHIIAAPAAISYDGGLPMVVNAADIVTLSILSVVVCIGASWYPAVKAAGIDPGQAVNYSK